MSADNKTTLISTLVTDASVFLQTGPAEALAWIDDVVRKRMVEMGGQPWRAVGDVVRTVVAEGEWR
jgi:hypothetical protein